MRSLMKQRLIFNMSVSCILSVVGSREQCPSYVGRTDGVRCVMCQVVDCALLIMITVIHAYIAV